MITVPVLEPQVGRDIPEERKAKLLGKNRVAKL
jgi:hypothetical protein